MSASEISDQCLENRDLLRIRVIDKDMAVTNGKMRSKKKFRGSRAVVQPLGVSFKPPEWGGISLAALWCGSEPQMEVDDKGEIFRSTVHLYTWNFDGKETSRGVLHSKIGVDGVPIRCEWVQYHSIDLEILSDRRKRHNSSDGDQMDEVVDGLIIPTSAKKTYYLDARTQSVISVIGFEDEIIDLLPKSNFNPTGLWVATKSAKGTLFEADIKTGLPASGLKIDKPPERISLFSESATSEASVVAVGARRIYIIDARTRRIIKKFNGHAAAITQLEFSPSGRYVASMADGENAISIWDVYSDSLNDPVCILPTNVAIASFSVNRLIADHHPNLIPLGTIASVGTDGLIYVWRDDDNSIFGCYENKTGGPPQPKVIYHDFSVSISTSSDGKGSSPPPVVSTYFSNIGLIAIRNVCGDIFFENILHSSAYSKETVLVRPFFNNSKINLSNNSSGSELFHSADLTSPVEKMRDLRATHNDCDAAFNPVPPKKPAVNGAVVTINGALRNKRAKRSRSGDTISLNIGSPDDKELNVNLGNSSKKADIVFVEGSTILHALTQAVLKNDEALVLKYMCSVKKQSINATIKKLEPKVALSMLTLLLLILKHKPSKYAVAVRWLRELMFCHASYLASIPDVGNYLGKLHSVLRTRAGLMDKLLSLSARLDVMALNIRAANKAFDVNGTQNSRNVALVSMSEADLCESSDSDQQDSEDLSSRISSDDP